MNTTTILRCIRGLAAGAAAMVLWGCNPSEKLLEAKDPDIIDPTDVDSPDGAEALRVGTLDRFKDLTGGSESSWMFGGLLADEWSTSSTFVQNDETDERRTKEDNSSVEGMLRSIYRTRLSANQAIAALRTYAPTNTDNIAEMYFARGFAELQLGSDFCTGAPLSDGLADPLLYGSPSDINDVFEVAVASFDSALQLAPNTAALSPAIRIARARAQLALGQIAEAGATVAGIPNSFRYQHTFAQTSGSNTLWGQAASSRRYSVGDSVEGNARDFLVQNAIPFFSAADPRVPAEYTVSSKGDTVRSQDGQTFSRTTSIWDQETPIDVANGIDARLIEAEAALRAGDAPGMLAILNALRDTSRTLGTVRTPVMAPLTDPGDDASRLDLLFREKAFWTFGRGQRLGDMRRLIRIYGRAPDTVFPVGDHYRGGTYGDDIALPVATSERTNPNYTNFTRPTGAACK